MLILAFVRLFWKSYGSFRFNRTVLFKLYCIVSRSDCIEIVTRLKAATTLVDARTHAHTHAHTHTTAGVQTE